VTAVDETPVSKIWREIRAFRVYDEPSEVYLYSLAQRLKRDALRRTPTPSGSIER